MLLLIHLKILSFMQDYKRVVIIPLFSLILVFQTACNKNTEPVHYTIPEDLKAFFLFQPGSYWIYQNSATNKVDCTWIVTQPEFHESKNILDDGRTVSSITDHCTITFEGFFFRYCQIDPFVVGYGNSWYTDFMAYNAGIPTGDARHYYNNYYFENIHFYDSLQVGGHTFSEVAETKDSHFEYQGTQSKSICFFPAKNVGLVQIKNSNSGVDTTWILVRYHIVQ